MALLITNGRYDHLIRLELMFSISLWKEFQLLLILNNLYIKNVLKLILYKNDVKLFKFKRSPVEVNLWCLKCEILIIDTWNE